MNKWVDMRDEIIRQWGLIREEIPWRRILLAILILISLIFIFLIVRDFYLVNIKGGYVYPAWTGFSEYRSAAEPEQRGKTLWDWLGLLLIPLILAIGGLVFNWTQKQTELKVADQHIKTEQKIASDRAQETLLQNYFDKMTELLLDKGLLNLDNSEARVVARARTLATVRQLDKVRKGLLLRFLYEAKLILAKMAETSSDYESLTENDTVIVSLEGVDFSDANLENSDLHKANLNGVRLNRADLYNACLEEACLVRANLVAALLSEANLNGAILVGAYLNVARLQEAKLFGANLNGANLYRADLELADLRGAKLNGARLTGANLNGANLKGAEVTEEQLAKAASLKGATMPDGSIHE